MTHPQRIFVFGSNMAGRHGKGSALEAVQKHGAIYGRGNGLQGNSYAIPTKDRYLRPLPRTTIKLYVQEFYEFALFHHDNMEFDVVAIGCSNAGYSPNQMAPLFLQVKTLPNVHLPPEFLKVLDNEPFNQ